MGYRQPIQNHQVTMHLQKVPIECGFWAGGVIAPYSFENDIGVTITINSEH